MRLHNLAEFQNNMWTSDEHWLSVVNVAQWLQSLPVYRAGGNQVTILWLLDIVYSFFGVTPLIARSLMALFGIFSALIWFRYLRNFFKLWPALYGSALLLANLQAAYFSKLSYDPGWGLAFLFIAWPCIHLAWIKKSVYWSLAAGLTTSLGFFTYPSFYLGIVSLLFSFAIIHILRLPKALSEFQVHWKKLIIPFLLVAIPILASGLYQHYFVLGKNIKIGMAGGAFVSSWVEWKETVKTLLVDVFKGGDTWYILHHKPFIDWGYWLIIFCTFWSAIQKRNTLYFSFVLTILIYFGMISLTTVYPGARRLLPLFLPLSFIGAFAFDSLLQWQTATDSFKMRFLKFFVTSFLMLTPLFYSCHYYYSAGSKTEVYNFGGLGIPLQTEDMVTAMKRGPVYIDTGEHAFPEVSYLIALRTLIIKYDLKKNISNIYLYPTKQLNAVNFPKFGSWTFITASNAFFLNLPPRCDWFQANLSTDIIKMIFINCPDVNASK